MTSVWWVISGGWDDANDNVQLSFKIMCEIVAELVCTLEDAGELIELIM